MTTFTGLNRPVFVDSGAWIALQNVRDPAHRSCVTTFRSFADRALLTTDFVLAETFTRLRFDASFADAESARAGIEEVRRSGRLRLVFVNEILFEQSWNVFASFPRMKGLSFVDATIGALAQVEGFRDVLGIDKHLAAFGLSIRPG